MKIFGIGLSRTGTVSLTVALKILGYNVIHSPRPELVPGLLYELNKWDGATDAPIALAFEYIDIQFPGSKFILTTRPLESWLVSYENYLRKHPEQATNVAKMQKKLYGSVEFNREKYSEAFINHHKKVKEYFKDRPNDLLTMDFSKGDGWEKLCKFLVKIPIHPFPFTNRSDEM